MHSVLPNYGCVFTQQLINHTCEDCFHTERCNNYATSTQRSFYCSNRQFKLLLVIREQELGKVRKNTGMSGIQMQCFKVLGENQMR